MDKYWTDRRTIAAVTAICLVACALCVAVLWSGSYLDKMSLRDEREQASKEAYLTRDAFEVHCADLVGYADTYLLSLRAAFMRDQSLADVQYFADRVPFDREIIEDLAIIGADGALLYWSGGRDWKAVELSDRTYFLEQKSASTDQIYFSSVQVGRVSEKHLFRMSRRMVHADGSFAGVVVVAVNPNSIARFYQDLRIGPQSTASLVGTNDRKLRARFPAVEDRHWQQESDDALWQALKVSDAGSYSGPSYIDKVQRTNMFKRLDRYPLAVVIGFSEQDVQQRITSRVRRQHLSEIVVIAAILGIALLLVVITLNRQRLSAANRDLRDLYEKVRELALFDALTGLPNRSLLEDRLLHAMRDAERTRESCALMYVDLDNFKQINDTIGHEAGDYVLEVTASRMVAAVRASDTVSRRGGDEFVVLVPHAGTLIEILEVADRLVQWVSEPILFKGVQCQVSASVGVAIFPGNGKSAEDMIRAADEAMYLAKRKGKNTIVLAPDAMAFEIPYEI